MLPVERAKLYWLIRLYVSRHHDVATFCKEFETTYNFEVNKSELTSVEAAAFRDLFDRVVLYSPFERDRREYPAYQSAQQIEHAVAIAQSKLDFEAETDSSE